MPKSTRYLAAGDPVAAQQIFIADESRRPPSALVKELSRVGLFAAHPYDTGVMAIALWFEVGRRRHAERHTLAA